MFPNEYSKDHLIQAKNFVRIYWSSELLVQLFSQWSVSMPGEIVHIRQTIPIVSGWIKQSLLYKIDFLFVIQLSAASQNFGIVHF